METLVATVLIVIVFMVASMVLNNLFANSIQLNDNEVRQELIRLQYQHENGLLQLPYYAELGDWTLEVSEVDWQSATHKVFEARHSSGSKEIILKK
jgi:ABC-type dipeptide/oligopeptide/nickel transport system permease component